MSVTRSRKVPAVISATAALVVVVLVLLLLRSQAETSKVALDASPKPVTAVRAQAARWRATQRLVGTLEPWLFAKVSPQLISAYVSSVVVRPGDHVRRGDVLATLDCKNATYASQGTAAQARSLEERERALASETARLEEMSAGGYVSTNELEQHKAQIATTRAQIEAARAQTASRSLEVNDCVLRAPFEGEIGARLVDPGAFVRPGTTLVTVVDRKLVRVTADAPETVVAAVAPKSRVKVTLLATGAQLEATIARRAPAADPVTRTVHFEIDLDPKGDLIPVGTTAAITVESGAPIEATQIPLTAANVRGERASLFVLDGNIARKRSLKILGEREGALFVERALPDGAAVVTEGRALLADGDTVVAKVDAPKGQP